MAARALFGQRGGQCQRGGGRRGRTSECSTAAAAGHRRRRDTDRTRDTSAPSSALRSTPPRGTRTPAPTSSPRCSRRRRSRPAGQHKTGRRCKLLVKLSGARLDRRRRSQAGVQRQVGSCGRLALLTCRMLRGGRCDAIAGGCAGRPAALRRIRGAELAACAGGRRLAGISDRTDLVNSERRTNRNRQRLF